MRLSWLAAPLGVCRLEAGSALPGWAMPAGELFCAVRTADELSIVCEARLVPEGVRWEGPFGALKVAGPLPLSEVGVLAALLAPLAEAGIAVFAVSSFDTDYLLVPEAARRRASAALATAGHLVA